MSVWLRQIPSKALDKRSPAFASGPASRRKRAAEALGFDKGQLSRWENENPRPTLENLGRLLAAYGVGLADLVALLEEVRRPRRKTLDRLAYEAESARLDELIRQMRERQVEAESRLKAIEAQLGVTKE